MAQKQFIIDGGFTTNADSSLTGNLSMTGHIIPTVDSDGFTGYDLGSPDMKWRDLYLSQGSLYIDGQKVIESNSGTIVVQADPGQSLTTKVSGAGVMTLESETTINMAATLQMQTGKKITDASGNAVVFGDKIDLDNNQIINVGLPTADGHVSTKGYVDSSINDVLGGAPAALDTLNEISRALDDDANYAATITASLGTKADTTYVDTEIASAISSANASSTTATDALAGRATILETEMDSAEGRLDVIEGIGEGSVAKALADAKAYADTAEADAVSAAAATSASNNANTLAAAASDATSKVNVEKARIDAIMSASTADADTFAEVVALVNSVDATNDSVLAGEISNRTNADSTLQTNINNEATTRATADTALAGRLDTVEGTGTGSIDKALVDAIASAEAKDVVRATAAATDATTKADQALVDAKAYADTAEADAIASAEAKDVVRATAAAADATAKADQALVDAKAYADQAEVDAKAYADTAEVDAKAYTDTREVAITSAYETYADTAEVDAVATAKAYTDTREGLITTAYEAYSDVQKARVDAILSASSADKDTFAEIVTFVNSVDTTNDSALGTEITTRATADTALAGRLTTIEGTGTGSVAKAQADAIASAEAKDVVRATAAASDATAKANSAQSAAEATAAADATSKANAAQSNAISTASADASSKANAAQSNAISTASADASSKANTAQSNAISSASADATTKANNALSSANAYANSLNGSQQTFTVGKIQSQDHFHSAVQTVTSGQSSTNASATVNFTFSELTGALHYAVYLNRQLLRPTEYSVSGTTVTVTAGVLASDDEIEVTGLSYT